MMQPVSRYSAGIGIFAVYVLHDIFPIFLNSPPKTSHYLKFTSRVHADNLIQNWPVKFEVAS